MDQHSIKNVKNPADRLDVVNKAYADRIKYKIGTVIFLILLWQSIHFHIYRCESFRKWKDKNIWDVGRTVGRWVDRNIKSNVRNWVAWLSQVLKRSVPYDILLLFPASGWTRNFSLDYVELPRVNIFNRNIIMVLIML